jgi:hypothetical protein
MRSRSLYSAKLNQGPKKERKIVSGSPCQRTNLGVNYPQHSIPKTSYVSFPGFELKDSVLNGNDR